MTLIVNDAVVEKSRLVLCVQVFLPKFVLEVVGGVGAIWGFSEAAGLRNISNVWFWRPAALLVGTTFLARWLKQMYDFLTRQGSEGKQQEEDELTSLVLQQNITLQDRTRTV
jgi:hypothetical protein